MKRKSGWKYTAVFMVIFLSAYFVPASALAAEGGMAVDVMELTGQGEVVSDVFVREGPSTEYEIIGTVRGEEIIPITGKTKDYWYRIEFEGRDGFVYGDYIAFIEDEAGQPGPEEDAEEPEQEEEEEPDEQLPEEKEPEPGQDQRPEDEAGRVDWGYLKLAAVVVIVAVIMAMTILILRSLLLARRQEGEEEKKRNRNPKKSRNVKKDGKKPQENEESAAVRPGEAAEDTQTKEPAPEEARTIVIREEDYQLHIDPKYFEDEPLTQPDYVTDYLKKKELEDTRTVVKKERTDDLTKAMKKLEELQEEIERLKNK